MTWLRRMLDCTVLLGVLICASPLSAQSVQQSGVVTPTHLACWTTGGVIQDCGVAAQPFASTGGVSPGPFCVNSGPVTGPYQSFCLNTNVSTGGILSIQNFGGAAAGGISLSINGSAAGIPAVVLPTVSGDLAAFNNTAGTIVDSGISTSGPAIWQNDQFFGSGRPWCDVRAAGAKGDDVTDDSAAFASCITTLNALGGGILYVPPGLYCVKSGVSTDTTHAIRIVGAVANATRLDACFTDVTVVTLASTYSALENITVIGKGYNNDTGTFGATHPAVLITSTAGGTRLDKVYAYGGSYPCVINGNDSHWRNGICTYGYTGNVLIQGTNADGTEITSFSFNLGWPVSTPSAGFAYNTAWASTTSYTTGQIVFTGATSYFIQATSNCTSGGSAPTLKNYGVAISDGSCNWQLVAPVNGFAIDCDTGCKELAIANSDIGYAGRGAFAMTNSLAGTAPNTVNITDTGLNGVIDVIDLKAGSLFLLKGSHLNGCYGTGCANVLAEASWSSQMILTNNEIANAQGANVWIAAGTDSVISNNQLGSGTPDVLISANITDFIVTGNIGGSITVTTGTSDRYVISHNDVTTITDGGSGTNKWVQNGKTISSAVTMSAAPTFGSITGTTQCLHVNSSGLLSGTGTDCGGSITIGTTPIVSGTNGRILYDNSAVVGEATVTGSLGSVVLSGSPTIATPTFTTSAISPILYGGSAAGSVLNLQSTSSGSPSGDSVTITAGGSVRLAVLGSNKLGFGTETNPQMPFVFSVNATTGINPTGLNSNQFYLIGADTTNPQQVFLAYGGIPIFNFARGDGTAASTTQVLSGEILGSFGFAGYTSSNTFTGAKARIAGIALENYTSSTQGTSLEFDTTAAGGVTRVQTMLIKSGVIVGSGTTDPGANTIAITGQVFASLIGSPVTGTIAYVTDALAANCGDTSCTTWGTTVTGGTGALKRMVWYNGTNWTLIGK